MHLLLFKLYSLFSFSSNLCWIINVVKWSFLVWFPIRDASSTYILISRMLDSGEFIFSIIFSHTNDFSCQRFGKTLIKNEYSGISWKIVLEWVCRDQLSPKKNHNAIKAKIYLREVLWVWAHQKSVVHPTGEWETESQRSQNENHEMLATWLRRATIPQLKANSLNKNQWFTADNWGRNGCLLPW